MLESRISDDKIEIPGSFRVWAWHCRGHVQSIELDAPNSKNIETQFIEILATESIETDVHLRRFEVFLRKAL